MPRSRTPKIQTKIEMPKMSDRFLFISDPNDQIGVYALVPKIDPPEMRNWVA